MKIKRSELSEIIKEQSKQITSAVYYTLSSIKKFNKGKIDLKEFVNDFMENFDIPKKNKNKVTKNIKNNIEHNEFPESEDVVLKIYNKVA